MNGQENLGADIRPRAQTGQPVFSTFQGGLDDNA